MLTRLTTAAGCRIQVHDCVVAMAEQVHEQAIHPASWSLSSYNPKTKLPQVLQSESVSTSTLMRFVSMDL